VKQNVTASNQMTLMTNAVRRDHFRVGFCGGAARLTISVGRRFALKWLLHPGTITLAIKLMAVIAFSTCT
jgi:hypothetical protein